MPTMPDNIQRHIRILIYWIAGFGVSQGWISDSQAAFWAGIGLTIANYAWSIWGMRLQTKLQDLARLGMDPDSPVKGVILTQTPEGTELAKAIPGPVVTEGTAQAKALATP